LHKSTKITYQILVVHHNIDGMIKGEGIGNVP